MMPQLQPRQDGERTRRRLTAAALAALALLSVGWLVYRFSSAGRSKIESAAVGPGPLAPPTFEPARPATERSMLPVAPEGLLEPATAADAAAFAQVLSFLDKAAATRTGRDFAAEALKDPGTRAAWEDFKAEAKMDGAAPARSAARQDEAARTLANRLAGSERFRLLMQEFASRPGFQTLVAQASRIPAVSAVLAAGPVGLRPASGVAAGERRSGLGAGGSGSARIVGSASAGSRVASADRPRESSSPGSTPAPHPLAPPGPGAKTLAPPPQVHEKKGAHDIGRLGAILGAGQDQNAVDAFNSLWTKMSKADRDAIEAVLLSGEAEDLWTACAIAGVMASCRAAWEACRVDLECDEAAIGPMPTPDGNGCTFDACDRDGCRYPPVPAGKDPFRACGGHYCGGMGGCDGYCGSAQLGHPLYCSSGTLATPDCKPGFVCDCASHKCVRN